jgi:hypothetical protein
MLSDAPDDGAKIRLGIELYKVSWRKIAITLIDQIVSEIAVYINEPKRRTKDGGAIGCNPRTCH